MTSSLHAKLPDDMAGEKLHVYKALLQGAAEIERREIVPESVLDILEEAPSD